ncbi:MAG: dTMP kinase, partial [Phycisphaerales bacterium]
MTVRTEMLLYMASRAQLYEQRIAPAMASGAMVLADRFVSSTLASQGTAGGIDEDDIVAVGRVATGNHVPDLTVGPRARAPHRAATRTTTSPCA